MLADQEIKSSQSDLNPCLDIHSLTTSSGENLLPHWECNNAIYHISFRLADSIPQSVLDRLLRERECLIENAKLHGKDFSEEAERAAQYLYSKGIEKYLSVMESVILSKTEIANLVANSLIHFDNVRYRLHAWCIMPNHVHVIVEAMPNNDLSKTIHSWKSYSAHRANEILGFTGPFWQRDAYNHIIRTKREYRFQIKYTWENPEKARLQNWRWKIDGI